MEDSKIVDLYLARDESAIQNTCEKYGARIRGISFGIVRDRQAAEECENDTYMETWCSVPPHEPRTYLFAFLARIARHLSLDLCRKQNRLKRKAFLCELSAEMEQCLPAPDDCACRLDDLLLGEVLNRFLANLPAEKRAIFLRRYWFLDSVSEIAARFGISESKVKTTLFRCRSKLRAQLEKEGYRL